MKSKSWSPSPSKSKKATPPLIVSGSSLSPYAPLWWRKRMPLAAVTSVNLASGISARLLAGAAGAESGVASPGGRVGRRFSHHTIPPAQSARADQANHDQRNARPIRASSPASRDGSLRFGGDWFMGRGAERIPAEARDFNRISVSGRYASKAQDSSGESPAASIHLHSRTDRPSRWPAGI